MKKIDMHIHSKYSDGKYSVEELLMSAQRNGITEISIADHDTIAPVEELRKHSTIKIIPAIEMSTDYLGMHILGYGMRETQRLQNAFDSIRKENEEECKIAIKKLAKAGVKISISDVYNVKTYSVITKKDVVRYLVSSGCVDNYREAYDKYVGRHGIAHIKTKCINYARAIELVHECGGVTSLAHPALIESDIEFEQLIKLLKDNGLDGIETVTLRHTNAQKQYFGEVSQKFNLFQTAGTDFHEDGNLGITVQDDFLDKFHETLYASK